MTIKELRKTTESYINIEIIYGKTAVTLKGGDVITLEAFGDFIVESITTKDDETITAALLLKAVKGN